MRTKAIPRFALASLLVFGAGLAQGAPPDGASSTNAPGMAPNYSRMDKDKDGTLSKREAAPNTELTKQWINLDVNQDGKLDEAEFAQFETEPISQDSMRKDNKPKY